MDERRRIASPTPDSATAASGPTNYDSLTLQSPTGPTAAPALPPETFAGYTLVREIHRGGQGVVYQAIQQATQRKVAIKVLRAGPFAEAADRARFDREIQVLGQLKHPNIVTIYDSGTVAGCHYFVMDYISGCPLDEYIEERRDRGIKERKSAAGPQASVRAADGLALEDTLRLFAKICEAVHAAHLRGVVHRDLKPSNIRVDADGEPHILDFGLAKVATGTLAEGSPPAAMTMTGQFIGTLPWASPEQAEAAPGKIDLRTDVYSLGVVLYQLLTGRFPYDVTGNLRNTLDRIMSAPPVPPHAALHGAGTPRRSSVAAWLRGGASPAIPADVETIVLKCLQKERERRYQSAGDLARDVQHYLAGQPIDARRDSITYLLRTRTATAIGKHPLATSILIVLLATLVAHWFGGQIAYHWTPANLTFEHFALGNAPAAQRETPFESVRVIALTDRTNLSALAAQAGLDSGLLQRDPKSLRRLHGRLMARLADAAPTVVAWDITFNGSSSHDEEFVRGAQALRLSKPGTAVIVALDSWALSPEGATPLSPAIETATTSWGCTPAELARNPFWHVYAAVQHGPADPPLPGLALAAWAAHHRPASNIDLRLNRATQTLGVFYWRPAPADARRSVPAGAGEELRLSAVRPAVRDDPRYGIRPGNLIGYYLFVVPSDSVLAAATLDYEQIFTADTDTLRRWLAGKIVVIGDRRGGERHYATADGRRVWGTYAHAIAAESLARGAGVQIPALPQQLAPPAAAAVLGVLVGTLLGLLRWARWLALAGGIVLSGAVCLWAAWSLQALCNPVIPALAWLTAGELAGRARRVRRVPRT